MSSLLASLCACVSYVVRSSDFDVDLYAIFNGLTDTFFLFSKQNGNQSCLSGYLVADAAFFFRKVGYTWYDAGEICRGCYSNLIRAVSYRYLRRKMYFIANVDRNNSLGTDFHL
jgi:hypothetical protein